MEEIRIYEKLFNSISTNFDLEEILNRTGCITPCFYNEYTLVREPAKLNVNAYSSKWIQLAFLDNSVSIAKEVEFYSWIALVSDIGGSLGLFLGFSFAMVLEWCEASFRRSKR